MIDFTLENLTFENCSRAYEIDRSDIPDDFVDDVPILFDTLKFGFENNLKGYAFLITKDGKPIGTILLGERIRKTDIRKNNRNSLQGFWQASCCSWRS